MSSVPVEMPNHVVHNQVALPTPGTPVPLHIDWHLTSGVTIKALGDNGGDVYLGGESVTSSNGYPLAAGEILFIEIKSLPKIYAVCATGGDSIAFIGG